MTTKLEYTKEKTSIRLMPFNYWICSIKNNELIFDSFDGQTKKLLKNPFFKLKVILFHKWNNLIKIKVNKLSYFNRKTLLH